ncbi:MAG: hypothetical protein QXS18_04255, partial [Thermoplasmata archaeon]
YKLKPYWDIIQTPANYHKGQTLYWAKIGWDYASGWGSINAWNFTHRSITFTESELPSGTTWYVNLSNGQSFSSTTNTITFNEPNGTYSYKVETANKNYNPFPMNGTLNPNNNNITIHFKNSGYLGYLFLIGGVLILTALLLIAISFRHRKKRNRN